MDEFGLANVLMAASGCLADTPEAALLTETKLNSKPKPTLTKYIEDNLCCPLSLIPTVYGVRLANHIKLGSTECYELHDCVSKRVHFTFKLRWLNIPAYSSNVNLGVTSDLRKCVERFADSCRINGNKTKVSDSKENDFFFHIRLHQLVFLHSTITAQPVQ